MKSLVGYSLMPFFWLAFGVGWLIAAPTFLLLKLFEAAMEFHQSLFDFIQTRYNNLWKWMDTP